MCLMVRYLWGGWRRSRAGAERWWRRQPSSSPSSSSKKDRRTAAFHYRGYFLSQQLDHLLYVCVCVCVCVCVFLWFQKEVIQGARSALIV